MSKSALSKSASLPAQPFEEFDSPSNESVRGAPAWKQEVNQRLAAHRNRRGSAQDSSGSSAAENPRIASARAAEAAARVAARYAKAPSYSQLLAGEARAVVRAAGAAAEAARNAQAAAEAVLAGLESGPMASGIWEPKTNTAQVEMTAAPAGSAPPRWQDEPPAAASPASPVAALTPWAGAQPRWEEGLPMASPLAGQDVWSEMRVHPSPEAGSESTRITGRKYLRGYALDEDESGLFSDESADRSYRSDRFDHFDSHDPMGSATVEPLQHLPANLIEFPRELVATRKARPRLAEGPHYNASHENSQLSIFEVDPELIVPPVYASDVAADAVAPPEWASIELEHREQRAEPHHSDAAHSRHVYAEPVHPEPFYAVSETASAYADRGTFTASAVKEPPVEVSKHSLAPAASVESSPRRASGSVSVAESAPAVELLVARLSDRMLAAVVDGALVTLAFLAAAVVVIASTAHPPTGRIALIASGCGLLIFGLLYQFLFLSYAEEGTPGMRYARIALCTFDDDNPTQDQMRQRIPALLLAALPGGLGLMWSIFDKDHLGWHDRMTRTYQRKY